MQGHGARQDRAEPQVAVAAPLASTHFALFLFTALYGVVVEIPQGELRLVDVFDPDGNRIQLAQEM